MSNHSRFPLSDKNLAAGNPLKAMSSDGEIRGTNRTHVKKRLRESGSSAPADLKLGHALEATSGSRVACPAALQGFRPVTYVVPLTKLQKRLF